MAQTQVQRYLPKLLQRIENGDIDPSFVITHTAPLEKGPELISVCGIPVVITTGADVDLGHPALSKAAVVLQKPHANSDLIEAIVKCVVVTPNDKGSPWSPSERATAFSKQLASKINFH
jgi:hypothetical protein